MNIWKKADYSRLYAGIGKMLACDLSQVKLYLELGRLVEQQTGKRSCCDGNGVYHRQLSRSLRLFSPQPLPDAGLLSDV